MKQRIITAVFALVVFIPFVLYGKLPFVLFMYVLATIGLTELLNMYNIKKYSFLYFCSILFLWLILLPSSKIKISTYSFSKYEVIILFTMLLLSYTVLVKNKFTFDHVAFILLSTLYVGFGFYFLTVARMDGLNYLLFVLFIIWATDTGAYFAGRYFGNRKLWPDISPNKTIEGAIGGILIACLVGIVFQLVHPFNQSFLVVLIITIFVSIIGQIGDLVASAYKRHYEVKDSGNLLPGHGGILDRMDSLIFVLPFLYLIQFIG